MYIPSVECWENRAGERENVPKDSSRGRISGNRVAFRRTPGPGKPLGENGGVAAHYEYSPFGQLLLQTGDYATANPFCFSNEYRDYVTGLIYYNYRFFDSRLGRWLNRDPWEEKGGINLYIFARNNTTIFDLLGLTCCGDTEYDSTRSCCINGSIVSAQSKAACDAAWQRLQALKSMTDQLNDIIGQMNAALSSLLGAKAAADSLWTNGNTLFTIAGFWGRPFATPTISDKIGTALGVGGAFMAPPGDDISQLFNDVSLNQSITQTKAILDNAVQQKAEANRQKRQVADWIGENCGKCEK